MVGWKQKTDEKKEEEKLIYYTTLTGDITTKEVMRVIDCLFQAVIRGEKKCILLINSGGGSVSAAAALTETMKDLASKLEITTIGLGVVASSATKIFLMGKERILVPNTRFLLHYVSTSVGGRANLGEIRALSTEGELDNELALNMVFEKTKITPELLAQKCKDGYADWTLRPEEVVEFGVAKYAESGWTDFLLKE